VTTSPKATEAPVARVKATPEAEVLIRSLVTEHGPLLFHQSGGCCDGSSPMCYPQGEFRVGGQDILLGTIEGCPVYIGARQFEVWRHTQLVIDVVAGCGGSFSLEAPRGVRFLTRSEVFCSDAICALDSAGPPATGSDRS